MVKDIYIIKNDINEKVYIGQAIDVKQRFQSHCKPSAATLNNELIGKAIQKYGRKHFYYEILETKIENYNEREQYWIQYYNSQIPNGYNILDGGEAPPHMQGVNHVEAKLTIEDVENLTNDLRHSNLTIHQLCDKYGFSSRTSLHDFNNGKTYKRDIQYPIRKDLIIGKLTKQDVDEIKYLLKTTTRSYKDIAKDYNVEYRAISRINKGIFHYDENEIYPIRER